jgi:hypothetical protein
LAHLEACSFNNSEKPQFRGEKLILLWYRERSILIRKVVKGIYMYKVMLCAWWSFIRQKLANKRTRFLVILTACTKGKLQFVYIAALLILCLEKTWHFVYIAFWLAKLVLYQDILFRKVSMQCQHFYWIHNVDVYILD